MQVTKQCIQQESYFVGEKIFVHTVKCLSDLWPILEKYVHIQI